MLDFNSDKEVFDYVRQYEISDISPLNKLFAPYSFNLIDIEDVLSMLHSDGYILIDTRSEKEYEETHIPTAINFPILHNHERHFVGTVYKNYSDLAAVKLAGEYAMEKINDLNKFLEKHKAKKNKIIVYCWRGGGRSKYLSKMIFDSGYNPFTLSDGIKSYRNVVNNFFSTSDFPNQLLELNGLTGCGKTELIVSLGNRFPVLNLEKSARHFSSLFGFVPYKIRGFNPVKNQSAFENNVFDNYVYNYNVFESDSTYIIESESKKVGDFHIPHNLFKAINKAHSIKIVSSFENRVKRLNEDYFPDENGYNEMLRIFTEKERFFRREISNAHYDSCLEALNSGESTKFISIMLADYYDIKYKDKGKEPLAVVNSDNMESALEEIAEIYNRINQK